MTIKLYMAQDPNTIPENTGIGRVVHAQWRYLPALGFEFTSEPQSADLRIAHANGTNIADLDVLHCHGLYWTGDPGSGQYVQWHHNINKAIIHDIRRARAFTVPSQWVAEPFRREMKIEPYVIGHGVDIDQWTPRYPRKGYLLWNKNRNADVCDPTPAYELAQRGYPVISTFAPKGADAPVKMHLTGQLPAHEMKTLIEHASIYLATTKETFGIGTVEALASGTPVLGYRHGGTADIVRHTLDGYLVDPGNISGLIEGIKYITEHWDEMSAAAQIRAQHYTWDRVMQAYAELYRAVLDERANEQYNVSVVITNYNYGRYIDEAIESCLNQTVQPKEIIVVDDGSTDDSRSILQQRSIQGQIKTILQDNYGVAAARNAGIAHASSPLIICLDADDRLDSRYIEALVPAFKADQSLGVAYSALSIIRDDLPDKKVLAYDRWPIPFDWELQAKGGAPPGNCIPSAAMFRRSMWERAGGYKQVYAPAEDAEFWTRGLSVGYTARMVTREGLFLYRFHTDSASKTKPWRGIDDWLPWIIDKRYPIGAPADKPPIICSYSEPLISVLVSKAYTSGEMIELRGQSIRNWEMITARKKARAPFVYTWKEPYSRTQLEEALILYLETMDEKQSGLTHICTCKGKQEDFMGCCGGKAKQQLSGMASGGDPTIAGSAFEAVPIEGGVQLIRLEYVGNNVGAVTYQRKDGQGSGRAYRGGNNAVDRYINAHPHDVDWLIGTGRWRAVARVAPLAGTQQPVMPEQESAQPSKAEAAIAAVEAVREQVNKLHTKQRGRRK